MRSLTLKKFEQKRQNNEKRRAGKKRKKSTLGLVFSAGAVLFAIAAVCMMFLNAVELVSGENVLAQYTGVQVAFGYSETYPIIGEVKFLNFSIMNLLPYILALAGAVVALLAALSKKSFLLNIIAVACFVAAAVFFFTAASYVSVAGSEGSGTLNVLVKNIVDALKDGDNLKIAIGSLLGGVFSVVAAACSALKIFVK